MKIFLLLALFSTNAWVTENSAEKTSAFRAPKSREKIIVLNNSKKRAAYFDKSIHLLVWNMFLGQKKEWASSYKNLIQGKDLILLQEFYLTDLVKNEFLSDKDRSYVLSTAYVYKKSNTLSGVATASHVLPYFQKNIYSKYKEPLTSVHKSSLFTYFKLKNGKKLLVVNVHTVNFVFDYVFGEQVLTLEKEVRKHKGPIIFAGDFNSFTYGKIKYLNLIAKNLHLEEIDYGVDRRKKFLKLPLDHVYYRGLKFNSAEVIESNRGSDHNAISVIFDII